MYTSQALKWWDVCRQVIQSNQRKKAQLRTIAMLPSLSEPAVLTAALRLHCWDPAQLPGKPCHQIHQSPVRCHGSQRVTPPWEVLLQATQPSLVGLSRSKGSARLYPNTKTTYHNIISKLQHDTSTIRWPLLANQRLLSGSSGGKSTSGDLLNWPWPSTKLQIIDGLDLDKKISLLFGGFFGPHTSSKIIDVKQVKTLLHHALPCLLFVKLYWGDGMPFPLITSMSPGFITCKTIAPAGPWVLDTRTSLVTLRTGYLSLECGQVLQKSSHLLSSRLFWFQHPHPTPSAVAKPKCKLHLCGLSIRTNSWKS